MEMKAKKGQIGDGSELPPFPDLRLLNLAHNKVGCHMYLTITTLLASSAENKLIMFFLSFPRK